MVPEVHLLLVACAFPTAHAPVGNDANILAMSRCWVPFIR